MASSDVPPWSEFRVDGFDLHSQAAGSDPDLWIAVRHPDESWTCLCVALSERTTQRDPAA